MRDPAPDSKATRDLIDMLKVVVPVIADYWTAALQQKPVRQRKKTSSIAGDAKRAPDASKGGKQTTSKRDGREPQAPGKSVHRLKIQLDGIRPPIWRRVEIASDAKLPAVSRTLLTSMGWEDYHLHAFRCGDIVYGPQDLDFDDTMRDEANVTLAQIAPKAKSRFFFDYDFGDSWEHTVVVEAIDAASRVDMPRCTEGARACPPEDCGGVSGYTDLIRILRDPSHDDYAATSRWAGRDYSPDHFDVAAVNRRLQKLARKRRAR